MVNIYFLILPGVHLLDLTGPIHVFYEAIEYKAAIRLHYLCRDEQQQLNSSAGLAFSQLTPYHKVSLSPGDYLMVAGADYAYLGSKNFKKDHLDLLKWLYEQHKNGIYLCSICTGAFVLAQANVLDGRSCTTHWKYTSILQKQFPKVKVEERRLFVKDDRLYSSAGVSSGIDLSLYLLEQEFGRELSQQIAREIVVYLRRNPEDPQLSPFLQYRDHMDDRVQQVQDYIAANLDQKMTVGSLADFIFVTPRHLSRIFKTATRITVQAYIKLLRKEKAKELINNGYKLDYVARMCGYSSATALKKAIG